MPAQVCGRRLRQPVHKEETCGVCVGLMQVYTAGDGYSSSSGLTPVESKAQPSARLGLFPELPLVHGRSLLHVAVLIHGLWAPQSLRSIASAAFPRRLRELRRLKQ
jgi:hypothetical protein